MKKLCMVLLVLLVGCSSAREETRHAESDFSIAPRPASSGDISEDALWFVPNANSPDLLELFGSKPERWSKARSLTNVFMFYRTMLDGSCTGRNSRFCGPNTLDKLRERDAFRWLTERNIKIATTSSVVVGVDGQRDCDGSQNLAGAIAAIRSVNRSGASISYIDMDEPWNKAMHEGSSPCFAESQMESAVTIVKRFMNGIRFTFPDQKIGIGLTEPYPEGLEGGLSIQQIKAWISALEEANAAPGFFHLDVDMNKIKSDKDRLKVDLQDLDAFCRSKGIVFGVIYWGGETKSNCTYTKTAMKMVKETRAAIGIPGHSLFMSFSKGSTPINLPEWSSCTHTRLIRDGWHVLTGERD